MKWGKDPEKRTKFGAWLNEKELFQNEIAKAADIGRPLVSKLCNDHEYKPSYLVFRKVRICLEKFGYVSCRALLAEACVLLNSAYGQD